VNDHVLREGDLDLFGRVTTYLVGTTGWTIVRLPNGWRARRHRAYVGPYCGSAPEVLRYLIRWGKIERRG
jgi:hypothetical protein